MTKTIHIIGGGLAGSEAALQLASRGYSVRLFEMRPAFTTPVHKTAFCSELVCSNSLKSTKPDSAAGMLKEELRELRSSVLHCADENAVAAGGALAVDRDLFASAVSTLIDENPNITRIVGQVQRIDADGRCFVAASPDSQPAWDESCADAVIFASGPLTSDGLAAWLESLTGENRMAFYDAAAPVVMADSIDYDKVFRQSRYEEGLGDYLNAPFNREEYEQFIDELVNADRVIAKDFETKDLFQACQPIEEIARKGVDAPRYGALKPVGLKDPRTGHRPWAALQLRAEDAHAQSFNLVGFQTNLTFPEQARVFRLIPGLEHAEFARYGVMHRNTFIDAPSLLDDSLRLKKAPDHFVPLFFAGQLCGTEGYCEAIRSGLHAALSVDALCRCVDPVSVPCDMVFGSLLHYATNPETVDYQPMHVNFGIITPLEQRIKNKGARYAAYRERGSAALRCYVKALQEKGFMGDFVER